MGKGQRPAERRSSGRSLRSHTGGWRSQHVQGEWAFQLDRPGQGGPTLMSGRIELDSSIPSLELSVSDSDFVEVARGVGRIKTDVPPGIYQLRMQAGPVVTTKLISLRE